ncbi:CPBP family intramembrane glutamic endopeptidase [Allokutzneria sp. NRRL B-24872]|uniref:CPBP family intramembrane glutamic endopeptidase n=1 Tax=Allokutzneria sp. NRRL B-24872 TaxID=1137961 RepID=UPI000A369FFE|nr:type II CAAX endopeptidase family protein [Allokutzneria sp. NRRL B-24872]
MIDEHRARLPWGVRIFLPLMGFLAAVMVVVPSAAQLFAAIGLPKQAVGYASLLVMSGAAVLIAYCLQRFVDRRPWAALDITLNRAIGPLLLGVLISAAVMTCANAVYVVMGAAEWRTGFRPDGLFLALLAAMLGQALPEEVLFRGYLFATVLRERPMATAVVTSALVFGSFHIFSSGGTTSFGQQVLYTLMACCLGFALAACRAASGTIWLAVGFHTGHNTVGGAFTDTNPGLYSLEIVLHGVVLLLAGACALWWSRR